MRNAPTSSGRYPPSTRICMKNAPRRNQARLCRRARGVPGWATRAATPTTIVTAAARSAYTMLARSTTRAYPRLRGPVHHHLAALTRLHHLERLREVLRREAVRDHRRDVE